MREIRESERKTEDIFFPPSVKEVLKIISDKKAFDILVIDLRRFNHIADFFVICTANSSTHRKAIVEEIEEKIKDKIVYVDFNPLSGWNVVDFGDFILHIFEEEERKFYDIEGLWADAIQIKIGEFELNGKQVFSTNQEGTDD